MLFFFRLRDWQHKIAGLRIMAYPLLGYMLGGILLPGMQLSHFIAVLGVVAASYTLNDFYDNKLLGEKNYLASQINKNSLSPKQAVLLSWLPLLFAGSILLIDSTLVIALFLLMTVIAISYSVPPLRLKQRHLLGIIATPMAVLLVVWQGYLLTNELNLTILLFGIVLFLFQLYLEMLHILEDAEIPEEFTKLDRELAWRILKNLPVFMLILSIMFSLIHPIFLITVASSITRILSLRNISFADIRDLRRKPWLPQWSLYEFALYAIAGIIGVFQV